MQYWINQNGVQAGPVTREELEKMDVSADAYVWCSGLEDWVKITSLPELADVIGAPAAVEPQPEQPAEPQQSAEPELVEPAPAEQPAEPIPAIPEVPQQEEPEVIVGTPAEPVTGTPVEQPQYVAQPQYPQQPAFQPAVQPQPECPPTNLVWAIIATVLCCTPMGIVAIWQSVKVNRLYNEGNYKGAEHASEVSAWWCIATIIAGIVLSPIASLVQMLITSM